MQASAVRSKVLAVMARNTMFRRPLSSFNKPNVKDLQPLVYPYTYTSRLIQFPWLYFYKTAWMPRYMLYACIVSYPLWIWIHNKVNSPEAKLAWEKKKKDDFIKEHKKEWEV